MSDLAELLRDWRLKDCEHRLHYGLACCSPCLRDRILASDWLAAYVVEHAPVRDAK